VIRRALRPRREHIAVKNLFRLEISMSGRISVAALAALILLAQVPVSALAQDIPGIEICTVEKTMERRTSCLQSNVDFLQKTITRLTLDHQQKIDAANRQIEALKAVVAGLQKAIADLQASHKQMAEDIKAQPAKGATAPGSETPPAKKDK
jgi:malonyl CoA-acyl carrier protein transacylase